MHFHNWCNPQKDWYQGTTSAGSPTRAGVARGGVEVPALERSAVKG